MALVKKVKNNTGGTVSYEGQAITAGAYYEIEPIEEQRWIDNVQLQTDVASGDAIMNNGTTDLSVAEGPGYLNAENATCIMGIPIDDTARADNKALVYNSASGKLEYEVASDINNFLQDDNGDLLVNEDLEFLTD
jgi:hypothetical protein